MDQDYRGRWPRAMTMALTGTGGIGSAASGGDRLTSALDAGAA
ncbi:MAG: hypothetical protein VCB77_07350 [Alphaproteobacteria bacterium]